MSFLFSKPKVKEIGPVEAHERLREHAATIVDVRENSEWSAGHVPGAKHIPLGDLQTRTQELFALPEVIFVCHSGARSASATKAVQQAGHPNVSSLAGGMQAWKRADLPVKR